MSAHTRTIYPEHVLQHLRAIAPDLEQACLQWGHARGADAADDAYAHLTNAIDTLSAAIAERDDYPDAQVQLDLLHAAQDERRAAA